MSISSSFDDGWGCILGPFLLLIIILSMVCVSLSHAKNVCLDSPYPRRWVQSACQEYVDDKWIEIDISSKPAIHYNKEGNKFEPEKN